MDLSKVDLQRSEIIRTLPNGDLYRIQTDEQVQQNIAQLPKLQRPGVAGALSCPHCGAAFMSAFARDEHIRRDHAISSGQAAVQAVQLPDGTEVPLELVLREYMASQERAVAMQQSAEVQSAEPEPAEVSAADVVEQAVAKAAKK